HTYHAVFTDASGVLTGSEVRIAGVRVGKVTDVVLHDGRARVSFSVLADQEVPRDAVVSVRYADLLGNRYLAVEPGGGGAALPPRSHHSGRAHSSCPGPDRAAQR